MAVVRFGVLRRSATALDQRGSIARGNRPIARTLLSRQVSGRDEGPEERRDRRQRHQPERRSKTRDDPRTATGHREDSDGESSKVERKDAERRATGDGRLLGRQIGQRANGRPMTTASAANRRANRKTLRRDRTINGDRANRTPLAARLSRRTRLSSSIV
ncbi:MAG TPA: hypothetical protein DCQ98_19310 [Planctomycetaceae bacterium]|nr:hypothetical protein [Planctomycetaceae bacterium]